MSRHGDVAAEGQHRYVLTAVVIVPSDEPRTEAGLTSDLTTALLEAGYFVKWADAREVTEVRA
jgi:hypothetical protein